MGSAVGNEQVRVMAVIPYQEYLNMQNDNAEQPAKTDIEPEEEEEGEDEIPASLEMVLLCCPMRARRLATLTLQYLASLNGQFKYDAANGAIIVDGEEVHGSNLSEILRLLLTNRPGAVGDLTTEKPREAVGLKEFLSILSKTAAPASLISDKYWKQFFINLHKQ